MKTIFLSIVCLTLISAPAVTQTKLGYLVDMQGSIPYTHFKKSGTEQLSGVALDLRINCSLLGVLFFRNSKFMVGDHIGAGFAMGSWKKPPASGAKDTPFMMGLNLQLGVKAAYAFDDDFEVGVKYLLGAGDIFIDQKNNFTLALGPAIIPSVRVGPMMGSVGFGTGITGGGSGNKGSFLMFEGRYMLSEGRNRNLYLFLRFENYSGKASDFTQKAQQAFVGIGFM